MPRIDQIRTMLEANPGDVFLRYALAMELRGQGLLEEAVGVFEILMGGSTPYVPAFFMCGQVLAEIGKLNRARDVLRNGIEQARAQGDRHAAGEMAEFLAELGDLGE